MKKHRVLSIDDSFEARMAMRLALQNTCDLSFCENLEEAQTSFQQKHFDLALFDVDLPDGNGVDFYRSWLAKSPYKNLPVFFVTGDHTLARKLEAFGAGALDYVTKPFNPEELKARVMSALSRIHATTVADHKVNLGNATIDFSTQTVSVEGARVDFTAIECRILCVLALNPEKPLSRQHIIDSVWGSGIRVSARTIDSHLSRIRTKLGHSSLRFVSIRGSGYMLTQLSMSEPKERFPTTNTTTGPLVDVSTLLTWENLANDNLDGESTTLCNVFLQQSKEVSQNIFSAFHSHDSNLLSKLIHKVASSAGQLGALRLSLFCREMEADIKDPITFSWEHQAAAFGALFHETIVELRNITGQSILTRKSA